MSVVHPVLRCSDAAEQRGDPRPGTAAPATRWLLVEQPGPWGRDAVRESRLDREVAEALLRRADAAGTRVLLVRRPGRGTDGTDGTGGLRWAVVDTTAGRRGMRWGRRTADADLLDVDLLDVDQLDASGHDDGGTGDGDALPLLLVCAHSRHDTCCAVRGRPLAAALHHLAPGRVWECSHVGGCRFAANVVVLPAGLYYGGLRPTDAEELLAATDRDRVVTRFLRGRAGLPAAAQAAEQWVREELGEHDPRAQALDGVRALGEPETGHGTVRVRVRVGVGVADDELQVVVRREVTGPAAPLTCAAVRPASPTGWSLVSLRRT